MRDMNQVLFCIEMHLVYDPMKERKTGLNSGNVREFLLRQRHIRQAPGGYGKIRCQVRLLSIKRKTADCPI